MTQNAYFSLSIQTEKLLLMAFDDTPTEVQNIPWTHTRTAGGQRMELEIAFILYVK